MDHASAETRPCKICGASAPLFCLTDFNRSCEDDKGPLWLFAVRLS